MTQKRRTGSCLDSATCETLHTFSYIRKVSSFEPLEKISVFPENMFSFAKNLCTSFSLSTIS